MQPNPEKDGSRRTKFLLENMSSHSHNIPKEVFDKMMEEDHFSKWMNVQLIKILEGYCLLRMQVRKEMLNGFGIVHGGITFSFADY